MEPRGDGARDPILRGPPESGAPPNGPKLTKDEMAVAKQMFEKYDVDFSGEIVFSELRALLKDLRIRLTTQQLTKYCKVSLSDLEEYEKFNVGLSWTDFLNLYQGILMSQFTPVRAELTVNPRNTRASLADIQSTDEQLRNAFYSFDVDHNGYLDMAEMSNVLQFLGFNAPPGETLEHFTERQFQRADTSKDGRISYQEFVDYVNALVQDIAVCRELGQIFTMSSKPSDGPPRARATGGFDIHRPRKMTAAKSVPNLKTAR